MPDTATYVMATEQILFPVLCISGDGSVTIKKETLGSCTYQAVRNGYYDHLQILDGEGNSYKVVEWTVGKKIPSLLKPIYLLINPPMRVTINKAIKTDLGFAGFKRLIIDTLQKHEDFYNSGGNLNILISRIREASTVTELFSIFDNY